MAASNNPTAEVFAGLVERVTFHSEDNGYCVLRLKARGKREPITVVGRAAVISAGEFIQASGEWANDRTHGVQFRARFLKTMPPTTTEGIEKYLGSGMIRGIGPVYARKLVRTFGGQVFDVIEAEPHRLREVAGIGPKRADGIATGWAEQRAIREIMIFCMPMGSAHRTAAAKARLGAAAMGSPAPGLGDDFTCESEGGTEIERKVGG